MKITKSNFESTKETNSFLANASKMAFIQKKYEDSEKFMTINQLIDKKVFPYHHIDLDREAEIVAIPRRDGEGSFLVMRMFMLNGSSFDLPLSYRHTFQEGDTIENVGNLKVMEEVFLDKTHMCITDDEHIKED